MCMPLCVLYVYVFVCISVTYRSIDILPVVTPLRKMSHHSPATTNCLWILREGVELHEALLQQLVTTYKYIYIHTDIQTDRQTINTRCWRDDSAVKNAGCSSKGSRFNSQNFRGSSQLSVTSVPGYPTPPQRHICSKSTMQGRSRWISLVWGQSGLQERVPWQLQIHLVSVN